MNSNDNARDRIAAAERMLNMARQEHNQGNTEDAAEFLAAARRNIDRAIKALEPADAPVHVVRGQSNGSVIPREVASRAR